jgi:hypothetical protein
MPSAKQRSCKYASLIEERCFLCGLRRDCLLGNCVATRLYKNRGAVFSVLRGPCRDLKEHVKGETYRFPCGGGFEYLQCSPASRRRRQKGKSRIWDSKIWSRVPRNSDPRMDVLSRASSNCKWQTCYKGLWLQVFNWEKKFWPWISRGSAPRGTDWR